MEVMEKTENVSSQGLLELLRFFATHAPDQSDFQEKGSTAAIASGFFNKDYYLAKYPDIASYKEGPVSHFLKYGYAEGRSPNPGLPEILVKAILAKLSDSRKPTFLRYLALVYEILGEPDTKEQESGHSIEQAPAEARPKPQEDSVSAENPVQTKENLKPIVLKQGAFATLYDMPLAVNWVLTDMCNYNCSYCFGHEKMDKSRFATFSSILNTLDNLAALNRPSYQFTIGGGEPTTHPHFLELMQLLAAKFEGKLDRVMVISNGSREIPFYETLARLGEPLRLQLIHSIHTDHVNKEHLYKLVEILSPSLTLTLNLMFNPAKWELVREIYEHLLKLRDKYCFGLSVAPLRQPPKFDELDKRYTKEHLDWQSAANSDFNKRDKASQAQKYKYELENWDVFHELRTGNEIKIVRGNRHQQLAEGLFDFRGMYCTSGTHLLVIDSNGECYGIWCAQKKKMFNIYQKKEISEIIDSMELVQCSQHNCGCGANDASMKFRDKNEAEIWLRISQEKQKRLIAN